MTVVNTGRNRARMVASIVIGVIFVGILALIGTYLVQQRYAPSRASAADCRLAQTIIDQAQKLPHDKATNERWQQDVHDLRMAQMKDGYLGLQIARYEGWAAGRAGGAPGPTKAEFKDMVTEANSHCATPLTIPPIAS
jgi:hypothetical protein